MEKESYKLGFDNGEYFHVMENVTIDEKWLRSAQSTTDTKRIKWVSNIEEVKQDILTNYS